MELKMLDHPGRSEPRDNAAEGEFVFELTLEQLAVVGGGLRDDESPKETRR